MSWNYRVLAHEGREVYFEIHEVYYDSEGVPNGYAEGGSTVGADYMDGLGAQMDIMRVSIAKPVLWAGDRFPEEYKEV